MVDVSSHKNSITIKVESTNKTNSITTTPSVPNNSVTTKSDTAQYWSNVSRDYSEQAKISAHEAEQAKNEVIDQKDSVIAEIENVRVEAVDNITTVKSESIASVEAKGNEVVSTVNEGIANINTAKTEAVNAVNSTKTTILNDIEFVADGEKQEILGLADEIKDSAEDIINRVGISMFDTILKDHILTYEETKGLALQGTYVYKTAIAGSRYGYPDFYAKCLEEYNQATDTETVNGKTVKVHSNGHKFYDIADKTGIDEFFSTMGSAWFYGVDTENERIFLPRNNYFEQATSDVAEVGQSVEAGLPNITGYTDAMLTASGSGISTGALHRTITGIGGNDGGKYARNMSDITFDASRSSSVYKDDVDTVQPNAVKKLLYICVGNTVADTSWIDIVAQVESGVKEIEDKRVQALTDLTNKENAGLSALSNASNALRQTQITNCLLEVPQNIKLELNDGKLTLKAGSKVIVPNGAGVFNEVEVLNDLTVTQTYTGSLTVYVSKTASYISAFSGQNSSSDADIDTIGKVHYNTTTNKVTRTSSAGKTEQLSFPIAIITMNGSTVTSIDQVFNGMGYIGSTVWVDKGVKGLVANGRNADRTLKSIEARTESVLVYTNKTIEPKWFSFTTPVNGVWKRIDYIGHGALNNGYWVYSEVDNSWVFKGNIQPWFPFADSTFNSSSPYAIISFQPKQPFRAVDYQEAVLKDSLQECQVVIESYINGSSWYRVWSDGWCEQGGIFTSAGGYATRTATFLKPFKDTNYIAFAEHNDSEGDSTSHCINTKTTTTVQFLALYNKNGRANWVAMGYIA